MFQEEEFIEKTVNALLDSDYPKDKLEVIVVDDGSTDKSYSIASKIKGIKLLRHIENKKKRFAFATGVEASNGDIVVCVDSDSVVEKDAIKLLVQPFKDDSVYSVCGHGEVLNKDKNYLTHSQRMWYADGFRIGKAMESEFGMVTCCSGLLAAYRKKALQSVINDSARPDLLHEKFLGNYVIDSDDRRLTNLMLSMKTSVTTNSPADDKTLTSVAMREREYNSKTMYQSNAVTYTVVPENFGKFVKQQLRWGRGSFRGMIFASSFFWKKTLKQSLIFYILAFLNFMSPLLMVVDLVVLPLLGYWYLLPVYFLGLFLLYFIYALNDKYLIKNITLKDIFYRMAFLPISIAVSFIYVYAWLTPWKAKNWMTR